MRRFMLAICLVTPSLGAAGCATTFYGSAPAGDGSMYVVGSKFQPFVGPVATAWRCPTQPGRGRCEEIPVSGVGQ